MKELINIMGRFGASFFQKINTNFLKNISSPMPVGINYKAGVSAQIKSAVIFAGLNSYGLTKILEQKKPWPHRKFTQNISQSIKIKNGVKKKIAVIAKKI